MSQSMAKVSALSSLTQMIKRQATIDGMQYDVMITVAAVAVALILTFFMKTKRI